MSDPYAGFAQRHREAAERHRAAARRHDETAQQWEHQGRPRLAELTRRGGVLEVELARLEDDIAGYYEAGGE